MKNVLVTGGTGFIGSNLIVRLLHEGYAVRAFHRPRSNMLSLQGVEVEHIEGDVRDRRSLFGAVKGCDTVFHTAAIVSFWKRRRAEQFDINVNGTRELVACCLAAGVETLVHTSSVAALGFRPGGGLIDEETAYNWGQETGYRYSKHRSELEILDGVRKGLRAVLVNPSVVIGPRDLHLHGGQILRDTKRGRIPMYVEGGMNLVGVGDVVTGHIAAAALGRPGERYILGGENLTHREVFTLAARVVGGRPPWLKVPVWAVKALARGCDLFGEMTGREPWMTSDLISGVGKRNWYTSLKAERELGYSPSPVEGAMREAFQWYSRNNLL